MNIRKRTINELSISSYNRLQCANFGIYKIPAFVSLPSSVCYETAFFDSKTAGFAVQNQPYYNLK